MHTLCNGLYANSARPHDFYTWVCTRRTADCLAANGRPQVVSETDAVGLYKRKPDGSRLTFHPTTARPKKKYRFIIFGARARVPDGRNSAVRARTFRSYVRIFYVFRQRRYPRPALGHNCRRSGIAVRVSERLINSSCARISRFAGTRRRAFVRGPTFFRDFLSPPPPLILGGTESGTTYAFAGARRF